ncbi:MAG: right-handed parallel beta-helix repeat-containing protein, partial [Planctomycetota bacterium]
VNDPCDLLTEPTRAENSYSVVTGSVEDCFLDGFTISGGNANGPMPTSPGAIADPSEYGWGGGMHLIPSSVTITNCTFRNNSASGGGGGIFSVLGNGPILDNCIFTWNSGGSVIEENYCFGGGGGMYNQDNNPTLTNCTFIENFAPTEGGGMYNSRNNPTLTNCTFVENSAYTGGGMYNSSSNTTLTNCIFTANSTKERGGGMEITQSNLTLTNCTFSGNSAYNDFFSSSGGGINSLGDDIIILTNCTFAQNFALRGNALCDYNLYPSNIELINCILWDGVGSIWHHSWDPDYDSTITITYSNIQDGWSGEGNIDIDPCFVNPGIWANVNDPNIVVEPNDPNAVWIDGDYHLKSQAGRWNPNSESWVIDDVNSPCIDAGDPNSPVDREPFPNGDIINMGAYGGSAEASKSLSSLNTKYSGGTGEPDDPYQIATADDLILLGNNPEHYDKYFILTADIDLDPDLSSRTVFDKAVIAPDTNNANRWFEGTPFSGVFDGNGHTISHLTISGRSYLGLFGQLGYSARISNLRLEMVNVNGTDVYIGGLAGVNRGIITTSYSNGTVSGFWSVGGLVGINYSRITMSHNTGTVNGVSNVGGLVGFNRNAINTSYSTASVSGKENIGGLVGRSQGSITASYSTGIVTGNDNECGLVGFNNGGIATSFWDIQTSGKASSAGGTGKTTAEMQTADTFLDAGWDFLNETENGTEDIWWINEGQDYPKLWWEMSDL